jgi:magnesium chelatase family protein
VLFLDELPEFRRDALEALRQPLEDGVVTIGRALRTVTMPASFLLVAAMNPCPCGWLGHRARPCTCTPQAIHRYRARLSGPLLDRIDLRIEVPALLPRELRAPVDPDGTTAALSAAVEVARDRQEKRQAGPVAVTNARLAEPRLSRVCDAREAVHLAVDDVLRLHHQSGRGRIRLLRLCRTLADLDDRDAITETDVFEATALRGLAADRSGAGTD